MEFVSELFMKSWTRQVRLRNEKENLPKRPDGSAMELYQASHPAGQTWGAAAIDVDARYL